MGKNWIFRVAQKDFVRQILFFRDKKALSNMLYTKTPIHCNIHARPVTNIHTPSCTHTNTFTVAHKNTRTYTENKKVRRKNIVAI